jgi:hypothetical protein
MSFTNLGCQNFGLTNPVTVGLDGNGAAITATFNTTPQRATNTAGGGQAGTGADEGSGQQAWWQQAVGHHRDLGRRHHLWWMNPSGM